MKLRTRTHWNLNQYNILGHCFSLCLTIQMGWAPLHAAANFCPVDKAMPVAKLLLDAGASVNATNSVSNP